MANPNFATSDYIELHTLTKGHSDTINSLAFSRDGVHLASGGDDHLVIIWNAQKPQLLYRLVFESTVDCVIWHPVHPETVIVGLETGYLFQLHDFSLPSVITSDMISTSEYEAQCIVWTTAPNLNASL
uniref:G protein beta subunit Gib2 n=1 Tax=Ganoderma boninense TaxID=34458 RepID=A0A5K1JU80_9APHY|nr:G protein beta subunit Gib2 [Ganoderma boninense]